MNRTRCPDRTAARRRITEQAAYWYLDHREQPDAVHSADFLIWLQRSPTHVAEYLAIARLHGDLKATIYMETMSVEQLQALATTEALVVPLRRSPTMTTVTPAIQTSGGTSRRRPARWLAAASAAGLAITGAADWHALAVPPAAVYTSTAAATREITLADGSLLRLDRDSAVAVRFDERRRTIAVERGGLLIDVGKDPRRPLQVTLGASVLRDVGTVFEARRRGNGGTVTVISGQVDVLAPNPTGSGSAWLAMLGRRSDARHVVAKLVRGEQVALDDVGAVVRLTTGADLAKVTAWLPAEIRFHDSTVAEVARRFNAYTTQPLVIDDPALASMRISGLFHAHDADAFVTYLATLPDVRVLRDGERIRIVGGSDLSRGVHRL